MIRGPCTVALSACLAGCARETWRNADLQVDVLAPLAPLAEQVRLCVAGGPARTQGAGPERYALPGLMAGQPVALTVDLLAAVDPDSGAPHRVVLARAEGVTLTAQDPWQEVPLTFFADTDADLQACGVCPPACEEEGAGAGDEEESWLLAVRFQS